MNSTPTFAASVDAVLLSKTLAQLKPGEQVSYDALGALVPGRELLGKHRYLMDTARGIALKEHGIVTGCVSGKGLKRLTNEEIVTLPDATIAHIRRVSKRASRKVLCTDYEALDAAGKQKFNSSLSVMGAIIQFTGSKSLAAVSDKTEKAMARLPVDETLMLFMKNAK
jgi:hypothetical protein